MLVTYRRLLRNRAFVRLLAGEAISAVGDWLYLVAILVVVYQVTEDPFVLGIVGAVRMIPFVVLSVPAGIFADRYDRRNILLFTDVARGLVMLLLAWLVATDAPVVTIVAGVVLAACFSSFFGPAIGAYLPAVVADERDLGPANSLWATLDNLAYFIGPAIAGLLIAAGGLVAAFLLNALSFAVVALVLLTLPSSRGTDAGQAAPGEDDAAVNAQAGVARPSMLLRSIAGPIIVDGATCFVSSGLSIVLVLVAIDQLGAGPQAVGYLEAATGIGGVAAGLVAGWFVARRLDVPLLLGALIGGVGLGILALAATLGVALVVVGVAVGALLIMDIVVTTLVQRQVPDALRGRAMGLLQLTGVSASLVGSLLAPALVPVVGLGVVLTGLGVLLVVATVVAVAVLARQGSLGAQPDIDPVRVGLLRRTILVGAPAARLETAVRSMVDFAVTAGEAVIREGDPADRFYLIADGRFAVTQAGADGATTHLRDLGPGDPFGEIGLLTGSARTATVTALTDGRLLGLERDRFLELVGSGPELRSGLLSLYQGGMGRAS